MTKIKKHILEYLQVSSCLVTLADIRHYLSEHDISPNRSTLYRELTFLVKHKILKKVVLADNDYYETLHHHHHLLCLHCKDIQRIDIHEESAFQDTHILQTYQFHITDHVLEFYGYCKKCQAYAL